MKLSYPQGNPCGALDLKIRDASRDITKAYANAVYYLIKPSQARLIAPNIDEASKKLAIQEERLRRATQVIAKADKSGQSLSAAYLATRDDIRYLLDQISSLQNIIAGNESRAAHLTASMHVKDEPVFPQKRNSLVIGFLLGGFLGLAFSLATRKWRWPCALKCLGTGIWGCML